EGYFDLNATFSRGGLAFYRSDREKLWVSLEDVEHYRETDSGRLVFPLKPTAPSGSMEIIWQNRGVPAPAAWNERIGIQIITGVHENGYLYLAKLDDYSFQYEKGVFRWDNLKPGEYLVQLPQVLSDGQLGPESLTSRFTVKSQETTPIRWGAGNADSLSGRILNAQNLPHSRVYIRLSQRTSQIIGSIQDSFNTADGTYRFESLFPGEYEILVTAVPSKYGEKVEPLHKGTVRVSDATQYDIPLTP
ncbi:MAG TPA: carboxypeptidase-like regulatory domain-containing protein, partial [Candidatus Sumerlaeota bacterium]|nr:carboxypeptidase-like regulatory domain-containing protein [Candidatus Sumerlaeota bacterium]